MTPEQLAFDKEHIWHPYTSMTKPTPCFPVASTEGVYINLTTGEQLLDGMASWWSTIHGYGHPELNKVAHEQIDKMAHVMFGGLTHEPAIELAKKLVNITPKNLEKVFIADSGSVAVEVAIKMAFQYWQAKGLPNKNRLITIRNGYHGDTFGAMAVCDPVTGMHDIFNDVLLTHFFADSPKISFDQPWDEQDILSLKETIEQNHHSIAALILEPIVQGTGGMRMYHPEYIVQARKLCDDFNILFIADEIATGLGRTGKLFACEHASISPDILCIGKALTGGYLSLAATITTSEVADTISNGGAGCFMHGPTFMGNPLACAIANKNLEILINNDWKSKVKSIEAGLKKGLAPAKELDNVADVRVLGAIGAVELTQAVNAVKIQEEFKAKGIWVRPFGKLVYVMPAYIMTAEQVNTLSSTMVDVISHHK